MEVVAFYFYSSSLASDESLLSYSLLIHAVYIITIIGAGKGFDFIPTRNLILNPDDKFRFNSRILTRLSFHLIVFGGVIYFLDERA